jgi:hypothetical protein
LADLDRYPAKASVAEALKAINVLLYDKVRVP